MKKVDDVPYMYREKNGSYKYARRVKKKYQEALRAEWWQERLGKDYDQAVRRCHALTDEHDAQIESLSEPGMVEKQIERGQHEDAAKVMSLSLAVSGSADPNFASPEIITKERWRDTETTLKNATASGSVEKERDLLALFLAYAFGDRSYLDAQPVDEPFGMALVEHLHPTRPTDPVAGAMFDAFKTMVEARLRQIQKVIPSNSKNTLLKLLDKMEKFDSMPRNTVKTYRKDIKALNEYAGEMPVDMYTEEDLQGFIDSLAARGLEATSVRSMFAGIGSVFTYAKKRKLVKNNISRGLSFPRDRKTTQERRYIPFRPEDVPRIWEAAQERFSPDGKSKLSVERRLAYLFCIKTLFHTGMRPHEFFRLRRYDVGDVIHIDLYKYEWHGKGIDIWFSKKGNRLIPLPATLHDLPDFIQSGGLDCVKKNRDIENSFSDKQFTPLLKKLGLKRPRVSLYSTRGTFNMAAKNGGADKPLRDQIIGHKPDNGMMEHYTDPETMDAMLEAMNRVVFW